MKMLNHDFIDKIAIENRAGFGFVPFVGSGLSVASGIITAQSFESFLAHTVRLCCAKKWNLRSDGWPPFPTGAERIETRKWIGAQLAKLCQDVSLYDKALAISGFSFAEAMSEILSSSPEEGASLRKFLALLDRAVGSQGIRQTKTWTTAGELNDRAVLSLQDWRTTLGFLASLRYDSDAKRNVLTASDPSVIDGFSTHITRGRRRNLAHSMLCHLASRMRMRIILTTNFDTLIEDAFAELGEPLRVLRVSSKGTLPSAQTVHSMNCCVKLHGELHETRADITLNDPPEEHDLSTFFHYITGRARGDGTGDIRAGRARNSSPGFMPSHLLVCGYSGSDERCMRMIEYVLDCDRQTKVFWICHTRESMRCLLNESRLREAKGQFFVTQTDRTDLLLYQLYQHVTLSLPRGGFNYQFNHNYPPTLWQHAGQDDNYIAPRPNPFNESPKRFRVTGANRGLEKMSQLFFDALAVNKECIWLELEDYSDVLGVAQELFQIISLRSGNYELEHTSFIPPHHRGDDKVSVKTVQEQWKARIRGVMASWRLPPANYVIFIYGRNGPGGRRGWADDWDGIAHYWQKGHYKQFRIFRDALIDCGFSVVYAPYDKKRRHADEILHSEVQRKGLFDEASADKVFTGAICKEGGECILEDPEEWGEERKSTEQPSKWIKRIARLDSEIEKLDALEQLKPKPSNGDEVKPSESELLRRFLFDASLFRQSRHYSALLSEAMIACPERFNRAFIDNDVIRDEITKRWLNADWLTPLLRAKRGGYLWLYRDTRMAFRVLAARRETMNRHAKRPVDRRRLRIDKLAGRVSKAHFGIGDWYQAAFCATGHAEPLLEALYHFWQAALHAEAEDHGSRVETAEHVSTVEHIFRRCRISIFSWIKLMRLGRNSLRFWTHEYEAEAWFDFDNCEARAGKAFRALDDRLQFNENKLREIGKTTNDDTAQWTKMMKEEAQRHIKPFSELNEDFVRESEWTSDGPWEGKVDYVGFFRESEDCWKRKDQWYKNWEEFEIFPKEVFDGITRLLGKEDSPLPSPSDSRSSAQEIVSYVLDVAARQNNPTFLYSLGQNVFELTYFQLRRAKLKERRLIKNPAEATYLSRFGGEWRDGSPTSQGDKILAEWVKVCVLSRVLLDLCMHLHPNLWEADFRMRVMVLGTYSLALGKLGRFHEAHRRLNEAHAIRSKVSGRGMPRDFGIIKLRRAELHLLEANFLSDLIQWGGDSTTIDTSTKEHLESRYGVILGGERWPEEVCKLYRMHLAKLDDAWLNLERAEEWLKGHSHSSLWWGRLIALQMRVFADRLEIPITGKTSSPDEELRKLSQDIKEIAFREARDPVDYLCSLFRKGENCFSGKPHQMLRLFHYYIVAERKLILDRKNLDGAHAKTNDSWADFQQLKEGVWVWLLDQYDNKVPKENLDQEYFTKLKESLKEGAKEKASHEV